MIISKSLKQELLNGLIELSPQQNAEDLRIEKLLPGTLLVPNHLIALDPTILLIIGGRGAGKTHLFRVISSNAASASLSFYPDFANAYRIIGYATKGPATEIPIFPSEQAMQNFVVHVNGERSKLMLFWQALVIACMYRDKSIPFDWEKTGISRELLDAFESLNEVSRWFDIAQTFQEKLDVILTKIDEKLEAEGRYLFVMYDDLDVIAVEWEAKKELIRSLLQFWQGQWRRLKRIRCKIFLRRDLFSDDFLQFPDASKFEGHKYELQWTYNQLYQLLFKSWANQGSSCKGFLTDLGIAFKKDNLFGWVFSDISKVDEITIRRVINVVIGEFMGSGKSKGMSYSWIPNHLQDANSEIYPRSFLQLFAEAARFEKDTPKATDERLIWYSYFATALDIVSERRIREVMEEIEWISAVKPVLLGKTVPMEKSEMEDILAKADLNRKFKGGLPPDISPSALLSNMIRLGIFRETAKGKIHVQDVYLKGFGMKRKGGIRRPK